MSAMRTAAQPPRTLADGVYWLSECAPLPSNGETLLLHGYPSAFVVCGKDRSIIVEGGDPAHLDLVDAQLDHLIDNVGIPPVEYVFATHAEPPHSGGVGLWLEKFPDALFWGEVHDYHLFWPQFVDRFRQCAVGDRLDLGGREFLIVDPVIRDLDATLWGFDTQERVLFPGDGFAIAHEHDALQCGKTAEEIPTLSLAEMTAIFSERALYWMVFTDMEPYIDRLKELIFTELKAEIVAPTHGMPITDIPSACPSIFEGMRMSSTVTERSTDSEPTRAV